MATLFKNSLLSEVGTTEQQFISVNSTARATVIGLSLANLTGSVVLASVRVENTDTSISAYFIKDVIIPPNQSLRVINGGEKLVLASNTNVYVESNTDASLDLIASYVEII
jgi:hypothetical protein